MGPNGHDSLSTLRSNTAVPPDSIEVVFKAAQAFHIKAVGQIQKRFHFGDDIYKYAEMVDPVSAQSLQPAYLLPFARKYGQVPWDGTKTEQEWRRQSLIDFENVKTMDAEYNLYPNLNPAVLFISTVSFSKVNVERFFSAIKVVKTDRQNKLKT